MAARLPMAGFAAALVAAGAVRAAADHIVITPTATYLHTNLDTGSTDTVAVSLASLGAKPGNWLRIERTGNFESTLGATGESHGLVGVFSIGGSLFPPEFRDRVPGALPIKDGRAAITPTTFYGNFDTDIEEDFAVDDETAPCATVRIPKSASHLFLAAEDSLYGDNTDAGGDFGVDITIVDGPCYPDFTADCVLDLFDFLAFQNAFVGDKPAGDCTGDGVFDLFDFLCFVNAFNAGC